MSLAKVEPARTRPSFIKRTVASIGRSLVELVPFLKGITRRQLNIRLQQFTGLSLVGKFISEEYAYDGSLVYSINGAKNYLRHLAASFPFRIYTPEPIMKYFQDILEAHPFSFWKASFEQRTGFEITNEADVSFGNILLDEAFQHPQDFAAVVEAIKSGAVIVDDGFGGWNKASIDLRLKFEDLGFKIIRAAAHRPPKSPEEGFSPIQMSFDAFSICASAVLTKEQFFFILEKAYVILRHKGNVRPANDLIAAYVREIGKLYG